MSMPMESQLAASRQEYAAILVSTFGFGVYIILACLSLHFLLRGPDARRLSPSRGRRVVLGYTCVMLAITVAWFYYTARNFEFTLVEQRYSPAGQDGQRFWRPQNIVQNVLATLQFLSSDALILYRTYVVCDRSWKLLLLPCGIYLSFVGIAITINLVSLSAQFGGPLSLPPVHRLATAFYVLCASQNLICLGLITARLVYTARASISRTTVTILAESAATYTLCSIVFVVLFQTGSPAQTWFGAVVNCSSFLCQAWIILRVAMHQAYTGRSVSTAPRAEFTTDIRLPSRMSHYSAYTPNDSVTLDDVGEPKRDP